MRRLLLIAHLLFVSFYCFAQQNLPGKIIGKIPDRNSAQKYEIQVGAFSIEKNTQQTLSQLRKNGLNPVSEQYLNLTRVMIKGIPADQVVNFLVILKQAGFNEVIIRENIVISLSEKWEINTPDSDFESFEFNYDMNYIAIENDGDIRFGGYSMPNKDTINMDNLGMVNIINNNNDISFTFAPVGDPGKTINLAAVKTEAIPPSQELDLFCRTWKVINCTNSESIGDYLLISNTGTYFFTAPDGVSHKLSRWRWYGNNHQEFEYSHDNGQHYYRAKITSLTQNFLGVIDAADYQWELIPVQD